MNRSMKLMRVSALALGVFLLATQTSAADVDGKWTGTVSTPMGDQHVAFEFKADGTTLTGTALGLDGSQVPIRDGKIDGSNITYSVTFDFGGMPFEFVYKGAVSPTEIKITAEFMGMSFEFVVRKS
jgi:hypothetical protein